MGNKNVLTESNIKSDDGVASAAGQINVRSITSELLHFCFWVSKGIGAVILVILLFVQLLNGCDFWAWDLIRFGFAESNFELSKDSRLPNWFTIPDDLSRDQISMTIDFFLGEPVKIKARGPLPFRRIIYKKIGKSRIHPDTEKSFVTGVGFEYPFYTIITIDGVSEVFGNREMSSDLYITDDPKWTAINGVSWEEEDSVK